MQIITDNPVTMTLNKTAWKFPFSGYFSEVSDVWPFLVFLLPTQEFFFFFQSLHGCYFMKWLIQIEKYIRVITFSLLELISSALETYKFLIWQSKLKKKSLSPLSLQSALYSHINQNPLCSFSLDKSRKKEGKKSKYSSRHLELVLYFYKYGNF